MYLSKISIKNFRMFSDAVEVSFSNGLNLLVGENGSGKSSVVDAIRALLGENEFLRRGIVEEDFYSVFCESQKKTSESLLISGVFSDLTEAQKVEYLSWLDESFNAKLTFEVQRALNRRNNYKQKRWGGNSSYSFFDVEPLNDIQCVYLPALRDAERSLRTGRGSRLARFIANLSAEDLKAKRENDELMPLEQDLKDFNEKAANESEITNATELINTSIRNAAGNVYGQKTQIRFNVLSYERIIESLQLLFSDDLSSTSNVFRSLSENSLGYNNLIYIATILAEFEGLKDRYTTPRILLIEELEAHLHPQLQIKLLKYLQEQAIEFDIQVIVTTHSSLLAASVPFESIIVFNKTKKDVSITRLSECDVDSSASGFLNRWLDATKTALFFSKSNIFVEGIAEAILVPELAKVYLAEQNETGLTKVSSLEEAGISVINMNGIYFPYFMQLYNGYRVIIPKQNDGETKTRYQERVTALVHKERLNNGEFTSTKKIEARCVAITDNDPEKNVNPSKDDCIEGNNPHLYYAKQVKNMTENCRVFINRKTFEYDLALESHYNAKVMLKILMEDITSSGSIKETMEDYIVKIDAGETIDDTKMAAFILQQVDSGYMGKGHFAQLLAEKIDSSFSVPEYIKNAIAFILMIGEPT
ncbi:recombinase RecF [Ruminococcus albus SY3]|uniref:Recombinase RecF n=1 Tax=Ruminococcus albus SY3 TaxID=1341156 RepID=A0A011UAC3_RUMAL|nr:AAA family ATPase [Ruminococcus albus]EXM37529.1 recombinase RecF [Ruminococcus albus SY3]